MGGELKPGTGRGLKSWAQRHLNVGFGVGFLLVLLTYLVVSRQLAVTAPGAVTKAPRMADKQVIIRAAGDDAEGARERQQEWQPKEAATEEEDTNTSGAVPTEESPKRDESDAKPSGADAGTPETTTTTSKAVSACNTDGPVSEFCELDGDVRTNGSARSVTFVPSITSSERRREWKVRPYSRRTMAGVDRVTVTRQEQDAAAPPPCAVTHDVPGVLFALGGLTGNYWHDFSDVLVPLYAASRRYDGDVVFLVTDVQPWWLAKYEPLLRRLSRYDAVDLDHDDASQVRCFRHLTVGLRLHKELSLVPDLAPGPPHGAQQQQKGLSMADFTAFLRETYSLPRASPVSPTDLQQAGGKKPRLLLLQRAHYRRFVNVAEIRRAAEAAGFEVALWSGPRGGGDAAAAVEETARLVNAQDVVVGVHGAGLTNAVFLPPGGVVVQVVPYGRLERMARTDFGEPVADMGLRYLEYSVEAQESTLLEMLGPEHPVIRDPEAVHRQGWDKVAEYYLGKQDVRVDVDRFMPTLQQAMDHLRQRELQR